MNLAISPMTKKEKYPEISIQLVSSEEVGPLLQFAKRTFIEAFGRFNRESDMAIYLDQKFTPDAFTREFQTEGSYFYLARWENQVIGYLKLNIDQAQNEPLGSAALEIERIYIDGSHQGKGLGQQLLDFAVVQAHKWQKSLIWLGVWDQNPGAIRFYERNGFIPFGSHEFMLGTDRQTDLLMKMEVAH